MLISFYHISLCPRCARVQKHLQDLLGSSYAASVMKINVIKNPPEAWKKGIKMVPAIACGDDLISGIVLSRESIEQFLVRNNVLNR